MNMDAVQKIADAVLYEGHLLYPYRASALKNRKRWNFGVLMPESYHQAFPDSDPCLTQTECLVEGTECTRIEVKVRFLHLVKRRVGRLLEPMSTVLHSPPFQLVDSLQIGEQTVQSFEETMKRELDLPLQSLKDLLSTPPSRVFSFPLTRECQPLRGSDGKAAGLLIREQEAITAQVDVTATRCSKDLFKLTVVICNKTAVQWPMSRSREDMLPSSFVSVHTILAVDQGPFLSLIDPPAPARAHIDDCRNVGAWPVLAGEADNRSMLLSAPIILYDYPQIAPESPGNYFDGTEIDEMLALRVRTLTEREKQEVRLTDEQTQSLLERSDGLPVEHLWKLHGVLKTLRSRENAS